MPESQDLIFEWAIKSIIVAASDLVEALGETGYEQIEGQLR